MNMVNTTYNSTEDMINKLQLLKGKTKLEFYKNISNKYKEMKNKSFQTQEDSFFLETHKVLVKFIMKYYC